MPSPTPRCSSYGKGGPLVALDYGHKQLTCLPREQFEEYDRDPYVGPKA